MAEVESPNLSEPTRFPASFSGKEQQRDSLLNESGAPDCTTAVQQNGAYIRLPEKQDYCTADNTNRMATKPRKTSNPADS